MDAFRKGWFTETGTLNKDIVTSIEVESILFQGRSNFQDILVFKSKRLGRVLALDNAIQLTEFDEFVYQEMVTFLPLNSHPNPKRVLIIGGGDGGVVREVVKHPSVESVTMCEIDTKVIEVSKKYLPFMAKSFDNPKLALHIGDGAEFVKKHKGEFDVIITDSSDPIGPAECLFKKQYFLDLKNGLRQGGLICSQGECLWYDRKLIGELVKMCKTVFPVVDYASSSIPTFPGGCLGYLLCSTSLETNFRKPVLEFSDAMLKKLDLKFYTPCLHRTAFALPSILAEETGLPCNI